MRIRILALLIFSNPILLKIGFAGIEIEGNRFFSDSELKESVNFVMPEDSISKAVIDLYRDSGFLSVAVDWTPVGGKKKTLRISEGSPTLVGDISVEIIPDTLGIFSDLIDETKGKRTSAALFTRFAELAISRLADMGMPFAKGEWTEFEFSENNRLKTTLKIIPGPTCHISLFIYDGISRTKPATIMRSTQLDIGDLYRESMVVESEKLIDRMPYLEIVSPFELSISRGGDSCEVIYKINELPSTRFDGAAGYVGSDNRSEFIGRIDLVFGDILGTGRSFGLFYNRKDRISGEIRVDYVEPFILGSRFDLSLEAFQIDRDSLFIETGGRAGFTYRFRRGLNAGISFAVRRVEPETGASLSSSTGRSVKVDFKFDQTDFPVNPRSGYSIGSEIDYRFRSNRQVIQGESPPTKMTAAGLDGSLYAGLTKRMVIAFRFAGWGVIDADGVVPVDELKFIGGFGSLRGYADQRFAAYRYGIATVEARLLIGRQSRAYLFGDFGAIRGSQDPQDDYAFRPGYGAGLLSPTALGLFKVEIGWRENKFPSEAIISFGVAGAF
jgi:outer membrane protein assembly factor BamA